MTAFVPTLTDPPLQEILYRDNGDPWRVAVACMLLNRTSRRQVDRVWPEFFRRFETSDDLTFTAHRDDLERLIRPLGLAERRAGMLRRMSHEWTIRPEDWRADRIAGYPGLGGYAQDAHDIFVLGRLTVLPDDRVLREWVRLLRGQQDDPCQSNLERRRDPRRIAPKSS